MAAAAAAGAAAGGGFVGERRKLFVGGIPTSAQEAELRGHFGQYGAVRSVIVMRDKETGHGRGFGFVEFEEEEDAARALGDGEHPRHLICGRVVSFFFFAFLGLIRSTTLCSLCFACPLPRLFTYMWWRLENARCVICRRKLGAWCFFFLKIY